MQNLGTGMENANIEHNARIMAPHITGIEGRVDVERTKQRALTGCIWANERGQRRERDVDVAQRPIIPEGGAGDHHGVVDATRTVVEADLLSRAPDP